MSSSPTEATSSVQLSCLSKVWRGTSLYIYMYVLFYGPHFNYSSTNYTSLSDSKCHHRLPLRDHYPAPQLEYVDYLQQHAFRHIFLLNWFAVICLTPSSPPRHHSTVCVQSGCNSSIHWCHLVLCLSTMKSRVFCIASLQFFVQWIYLCFLTALFSLSLFGFGMLNVVPISVPPLSIPTYYFWGWFGGLGN